MSEPPSYRPSPEVIREFNDRGTQWLLEDPESLRGVLQIQEPDLAARLDFTHAIRVNRTFVPADLQKRESDVIFRVPFLPEGPGRSVWVYVLLEHQSVPDPLMGLRLYFYMGALWDLQQREWEDRRLPAEQRRLHPIIPLVFYTGEERWSTPIDLAVLMDLPVELERFVPRWETLFLDLRRTPGEMLTRFTTAVGWALRALQAEQSSLEEVERVLTAAMGGLEGLPEEQAGQWLRAAWYLVLLVFHRRREDEQSVLIHRLLEQAQV